MAGHGTDNHNQAKLLMHKTRTVISLYLNSAIYARAFHA